MAHLRRPAGAVLSDLYPGSPLAPVADTVMSDGTVGASSSHPSVTATGHATPFTDGTYAEVDASLSADAIGVYISHANTSTTGTCTSTVLELATGAGGAEVAWATIPVGYCNTLNPGRIVFVPGFIAAGTRVAVRVRSNITLKAVAAYYYFVTSPSAFLVPPPTTMGGANIATTAAGITLTAPGSLNTKSAWTEITASTTNKISRLVVGAQAVTATVMNGSGVLVDVGVGASGAETVLIPDIDMLGSSTEYYDIRSPDFYSVDIPPGSRIAARYQRASTSNPVDLILVGA